MPRVLLAFGLCLVLLAPVALAQTASKTLSREYDRKSQLDALAFGQAVAMIGDAAFVGERLTSNGQGAVFVYHRDGATGDWVLHQRLAAPNAFVGDRFGEALAASGGRLLVGAPGANDAAGGAHVFARDADGDWIHAETLTPSAPAGTQLGRIVAFSGSIALVGNRDADERRGSVVAMRRDDTGRWREDTIELPQRAPGDRLGQGMAVSGDRLALGAPWADEERGAVYTYTWDAGRTAWVPEATLQAADGGGARALFGYQIGFANGDLIVSAPVYESAGGVEVYGFDEAASAWGLQQQLLGDTSDNFGISLDVRADTLTVGAIGMRNFEGGAYVFVRDANKPLWLEAGRLDNPSSTRWQSTGRSVAAAGANVLIGAPTAEENVGAGYVFRQADAQWTAEATLQHADGRLAALTGDRQACVGGVAGAFPCRNVDVLAYLPVSELGGGRLNDVWGWTDPSSGIEYAIVGRTNGTAFVELSDPTQPRYLGDLPMVTFPSTWRDMKVYQDHAFIVADGAGQHGMQVFDLTQLRAVTTPQTFVATASYTSIGSVHNIALNPETGFAYLVGGNSGGDTCGGGLHILDVRTPADPQFVRCYRDVRGNQGYTHDTQCTIYRGPDADYQGREVCVNANVQAVTILDVTDKDAIIPISVMTYPDAGYIHQGWMSEDHRTFYLNDEADESRFSVPTRTLIWDVTDLDNPEMLDPYLANTTSVDHNLYIKGDLMYQTNYESGFRVLDISTPGTPVEIAYLDTTPADIGRGTWSNYPYFESGVIPVTSITEGLFILEVTAEAVTETEPDPSEQPADFALDLYPNPFADVLRLRLDLPAADHVTITLTDALGRIVRTVHDDHLEASSHRITVDTRDLAAGNYVLHIRGAALSRAFPVARIR
ncbi:MAG: choice-of-anchor B family protein [Myxococcota bacterium]